MCILASPPGDSEAHSSAGEPWPGRAPWEELSLDPWLPWATFLCVVWGKHRVFTQIIPRIAPVPKSFYLNIFTLSTAMRKPRCQARSAQNCFFLSPESHEADAMLLLLLLDSNQWVMWVQTDPTVAFSLCGTIFKTAHDVFTKLVWKWKC